jgi:hypothetical protein
MQRSGVALVVQSGFNTLSYLAQPLPAVLCLPAVASLLLAWLPLLLAAAAGASAGTVAAAPAAVATWPGTEAGGWAGCNTTISRCSNI